MENKSKLERNVDRMEVSQAGDINFRSESPVTDTIQIDHKRESLREVIEKYQKMIEGGELK